MLKIAKKYILFFSKDKEKEILELMKKDWHFEVIDKKQAEEETLKDLQKINYSISSLDFVITYLLPYSEKQGILDKINNPKISIEKKDIINFHKKEELDILVKNVVGAEKELKSLEKDIGDKEDKIKELEQFGSLGFVPRETNYIFSLVVAISRQKQETFENFSRKVSIKEINQESSKIFYSVLGLKEDKDNVLGFLKNINGDVLDYRFSNIPSKEKEIILKQIKENKEKEEMVKQKLKDIAESLLDFKIYYDVLCLEKRQVEVKKRSLGSKFLNYVLFFAPEEEKEELEKSLPEGVGIVETGLDKDESPPVYMENSKAIEPFESVTNIFGLPSAKEIDPTPYLAFFFIIFFGICITDAGYGFLLALFTGLSMVLFKKRLGKSKLIKLLFYGGISTFIVGVLFGSYFGVSPDKLHISFMNTFKVIDSVKDTILFMGIAFFLGYIQICFSQVVKMIKARKFKQKDEFLSGLGWLSLFLFSGVYLLSMIFPYLKSIGLIGIIASLAGLFLIESKGQKMILKPLVGGIKILQFMINTVSDILSYSRLMALGLGTGVIALVVNQIAFLLGSMIPYVGWMITVLILITGHIFNLGINALGGFIHSARLQFVEFFPKFMEGGGRRLDPIGQELKYTQINN